MTNSEIDKEVEKLRKKLDILLCKFEDKEEVIYGKITNLIAQYTFSCGHCHTESQIGDAVFIEHYWYESPHGCTGGDNWWLSEEVAAIECPVCKSNLRIYTPKHADFFAKKRHFKAIKKDNA